MKVKTNSVSVDYGKHNHGIEVKKSLNADYMWYSFRFSQLTNEYILTLYARNGEPTIYHFETYSSMYKFLVNETDCM